MEAKNGCKGNLGMYTDKHHYIQETGLSVLLQRLLLFQVRDHFLNDQMSTKAPVIGLPESGTAGRCLQSLV